MTGLTTLIERAAAALTVPLTPYPKRRGGEGAVWRLLPGASDGVGAISRLEVRVFAETPERALAELQALGRAILADGDGGTVGEGADALVIRQTAEGGAFGRVRATGLYYAAAGYEVRARGGK